MSLNMQFPTLLFAVLFATVCLGDRCSISLSVNGGTYQGYSVGFSTVEGSPSIKCAMVGSGGNEVPVPFDGTHILDDFRTSAASWYDVKLGDGSTMPCLTFESRSVEAVKATFAIVGDQFSTTQGQLAVCAIGNQYLLSLNQVDGDCQPVNLIVMEGCTD
ncbi:hypothetical protein NEOLI_004180 [Neolecta irregularis DAH-3]|uniref:Uncharacterized protein n=1 Tax=Neolecta irregularis (strain DAH-3) TaxID=1198029 RepID=A0A1U7LK03_NEOID|nr:hypothetical protein NEOLI_004180 [Neolecta irregularis DAH-3]|eukprot:OLL22974.1 hypothetical protein NEOLI_004180 [Neolecta irregularis DAH-3]